MTTIIFYEKTGCSGNSRQRALLEASGHEVVPRDLRQEKWTRVRLLGFFAGLPVADWFNRNAPSVKCGDIVPAEIDESTALGLMLDDPLLIRRPLLEVGEERMVGFDIAALDAWLGLGQEVVYQGWQDVEACRHGDDPTHRCHDPLAP
jgi:nitrogenase-associated protein